jgi:hypothetical protein
MEKTMNVELTKTEKIDMITKLDKATYDQYEKDE